MSNRWPAVAALVAIAASACAPKAPANDMAADTAAIQKLGSDYATAFKAMNADAVGAMFTDDGRSMENAQPTATGPSGVSTAMKGFFEQMSAIDIIITSEKIDASGDLAYDRGTYSLTLTPKGAPAALPAETGRYLVALRRQADGSWKIAEVMGNLPTAPAGAPAAK